MIYIKFHFLSGFSLKALGFCTKKFGGKLALSLAIKVTQRVPGVQSPQDSRLIIMKLFGLAFLFASRFPQS